MLRSTASVLTMHIPGVPKVGPKTAVALLAEFDGIEDILAGLDQVAELSIRGAKGVAQRIGENEEILAARQSSFFLQP